MHSSNKKIAINYAEKVWNEKNFTVIDDLVHENIVIHSLLGDFQGRPAMRAIVESWLKGFPDLRVHHDIVITENDMVNIQWQATGTHQGEFKGLSPTGKKISYSGVTLYRIKNNKIIEYWAYLDMNHLLNQLQPT